ncbi:MAG: NnrU family protein [Burkholderiaceae bacterium]|nr:NnrU family protein [Burkholderiaceae bacterium]
MFYLVMGLVFFLGIHTLRIVADDWRSAKVAGLGLMTWKGIYAAVSLAGVALVILGFGLARASSIDLWQPARWSHHAAGLLTLVAFVLLVAAYVPSSRIKGLVGHPMVAGLMVWSVGHLIANGRLADLVLFGTLLVWASAELVSLRKRDKATGVTRDPGSWANDIVTLIIAVVFWYIFALHLHYTLVGVAPFG